MVFVWMLVIFIYFDDFDGYIFEFIGILKGKFKFENGIILFEKWKEFEKEGF